MLYRLGQFTYISTVYVIIYIFNVIYIKERFRKHFTKSLKKTYCMSHKANKCKTNNDVGMYDDEGSDFRSNTDDVICIDTEIRKPTSNLDNQF